MTAGAQEICYSQQRPPGKLITAGIPRGLDSSLSNLVHGQERALDQICDRELKGSLQTLGDRALPEWKCLSPSAKQSSTNVLGERAPGDRRDRSREIVSD